MKQKCKKLLSVFLSMAMLLSITAGLDFSAYALYSTGQCGENVSWSFDSSTGELTISGTGKMYDYDWGDSPFYDDDSVKSAVIENGITSIGYRAFAYCSSLTSVTIPNSVTSIGNDAFSYCSSLTSVTIPDSVTSIRYGAFKCCSSLTNITIPNSVTSIGDYAFIKCTSLTSITIPNSVTSIGNRAFFECTSLTSITIPNSVTSIGDDAFARCSRLTSVTISNSVTSIGDGVFESCSSLTSVTIPDSVTSIGYGAFAGCSSLTSITIPNSVTSIGDYAFYNCSSLTSITIPNSVISIRESAFYDCSSLKDVYYTGSEQEWNNISIADYNYSLTNATIHYNYVPTCSHNVVIDKAVAATCTTTGKKEGSHCSTCGEVLVAQKETAKLGHNYKTVVVAPTCTAKGYTTYTCKVCKHSYKGNYKNATGHKVVTDKAVAATCTKAGKTAGSHCSVCKAVIKKQSVVKAKGHSYDKGKVTTKPTDKKTGVLTYTCKTCKAKKTEKLAKLTNVSGFKAAAKSKAIAVSWKKNSKMTGYEIQYSTDKNFKKAKTVKVTKNSTTKTTIKKLSSKKYYYVRVRTYKTIKGTSCPASWSKAIKVKTK